MASLAYTGSNTAYSQASQPRKPTKEEERRKLLEDGMAQDQRELEGLLARTPKYQSALSPEFQRLKAEAFGTGPMAAYEAQRAQARDASATAGRDIQRGLTDELGRMSTAQAGAQANAYSQLAMGGGLASGARERVASGGMLNSMFGRQAARLGAQRAAEDNTARLNQGLLGIGTAEAQARTAQQNTLTDAINKDLAAKNQYGLDMYNKKADLQAGFLKNRADQRVATAYQK